MYKLTIFISFFILTSFFSIRSYPQNSFSYLVSTPDDERIFDGVEDDLGNYYMVGRKYKSELISNPAYFLVLNSEGQLVYEHDYMSNDTSSYFGSVYYKNDSIIIFGAKGLTSSGIKDELWMLVLDNEFNIIKSKTYSLENYYIVDFETIINHKGNYVICGMIALPQFQNDMFFYEISPTGDSVNHAIVSLEGMQMEFDLIDTENGDYKVFAYGKFPGGPQTPGKIVKFDSSFNYVSADSLPNQLYDNHSAKWLNDSFYIVSGNQRIYNPDRTDIGIIKLNTDDDLILGNHFGKTGDTISYVGGCSNLDVVSENSIYFGGASNIFPEHLIYQPEHSWLFLNNIDSDLNLNWQRFYGGDAFYYLWGLKATQDGGCLLMATRYNAEIQDHELDIFILKVDSNGLLTSTGDYPAIPVQQLSIFPNPAINLITIRYPDIFGSDEKEIIIFNSHGNEVRHNSATQNLTETIVDIGNLPVGLYFAVLQVEGEKVATGKFLVVG